MSKSVFSRDWWRAAGVRAVKTAAQAFAATVGAAVVLTDVNWGYVVSASLLAAILSLVTSIAGLPELGGMEAEMGLLASLDQGGPEDVAEVEDVG